MPHNLPELLDRAARDFGDRPFATCGETGRVLTFQALQTAVWRFAGHLRSRFGILPGDHVALMLPNCTEFLPAYFGILCAGAVAVPINARLKPAELEFILANSNAKALLVHPKTWSIAAEGLRKVPDLKHVIATGFAPAPTPEGTVAMDGLLATESPPLPSGQTGLQRQSDDVAAIIYTSGTTGRPKGAMLTHQNILFNVEATKAGHGLRPDDIHLLIVPLFHVTGLNTIMPTALDQGGQLVVSLKIDPEDLIETIAQFRCTTFFGVPTTFYLLTSLKAPPREKLSSLRLVCYSGAPMSPQVIEKLRALLAGVELHNFYGLTETTSVSTVLPDAQALPRCESVGLAPPGLDLRVVDENDQPLPPGQIGELCIRGPSVLKGYYQRPEATAEAIRDGWFHSGDTALMDAEGYVFLRGRKKELIIVVGENVYPIEVENVICAHDAIQEAAVFGREDKALGEVVHAAVVLRPGAQATERELRAFVMERLAAFKVPRTIRILERLPRNPSGKVMKRDL
jgi:long-chain acyl-CoA synthetase